MANMNAAVVTNFGEPPHYQQFEVPEPTGDGQALVDVSPSACTHGSAPTRAGLTTQAGARCR